MVTSLNESDKTILADWLDSPREAVWGFPGGTVEKNVPAIPREAGGPG